MALKRDLKEIDTLQIIIDNKTTVFPTRSHDQVVRIRPKMAYSLISALN